MKIKCNLSEIEKKYPAAYKLYQEACIIYGSTRSMNEGEKPLIEFFDEQGLYITTIPEFYKEGINWNLQILWYTDKKDWPTKPTKHIDEFIIRGTMAYGDNNEFPIREECQEAGYVFAFELLERKILNKKMLPDIMDEINNGDELEFNKLFYNINKKRRNETQ